MSAHSEREGAWPRAPLHSKDALSLCNAAFVFHVFQPGVARPAVDALNTIHHPERRQHPDGRRNPTDTPRPGGSQTRRIRNPVCVPEKGSFFGVAEGKKSDVGRHPLVLVTTR